MRLFATILFLLITAPAWLTAVLAQDEKQTPFSIKNVNSHTLGVVGTDPATGRQRTGVLIPRNTPLPVTAKRTFQTQRAGQKTILIEVLEGESAMPADCSQIGQCIARNLPADLPAKTPIDVHFRYQENGRLKLGKPVVAGKLLAGQVRRPHSRPILESAESAQSHHFFGQLRVICHQ